MFKMKAKSHKLFCDRCGSCCKQGGPALHAQDMHLFTSGFLRPEHLITVRQGELAYQPLSQIPEPVNREFLKLAGANGSWCCQFYDHEAGACSIYSNRPVACGLFDCTEPDAILTITGKDLLTRFNLIEKDDPLLSLVREHTQTCPCPDLSILTEELDKKREETLSTLTDLVVEDLDLRALAARRHNLSVQLELFYFGRPLFQLLRPVGITVTETVQGLHLSYNPG